MASEPSPALSVVLCRVLAAPSLQVAGKPRVCLSCACGGWAVPLLLRAPTSDCGRCAEAKPQLPPLPAATGLSERGAEPCALPPGPDRAGTALFVFQID